MLAEKTGEEDRELHLQVREYERNTRGGIDGNDKGFCSRKREGGRGLKGRGSLTILAARRHSFVDYRARRDFN